MSNPWKYATIGTLALALTAVTSSVMTAYVMRPVSPEKQPAIPESDASREAPSLPTERPAGGINPAPRRVSAPRRLAMVSPTEPTPGTPGTNLGPAPTSSTGDTHPGTAPSVAAAARTEASALSAPTAPLPASLAAPVAPASELGPRRSSSATPSVSADCATGSDRAWRIAKPGALGGLVGAVLGAGSGAVADGGKGAGKGALIGAGVGAIAGGAYGAYKTQQECGTIFGTSGGVADHASATPSSGPDRAETSQAGFGSSSPRQAASDAEAIAIHDVR